MNGKRKMRATFALGFLVMAASACAFTVPKDGGNASIGTGGGTSTGGGASGGSTIAGSSTGGSGGGASTGTGSNGGGTATSGTVTATFQQVYSQILQPKCVGCHNSGGQRPDLSSYSGFAQDTRYVIPGNPSQSAIYTATASGSMPQGGSPLTSDQQTLLSNWIEQGALNN